MPTKLHSIERIFFPPVLPNYLCANCRSGSLRTVSHGRSLNSQRTKAFAQRRAASTTPSVTAVNVQREIPARLKELHITLKRLERDAAVYVNTSQLQLALRGVESENPVIRIAVLGLQSPDGARKLIRALLADPLNEEQAWERELLGSPEAESRAILLRYNESYAKDDRHPLVRTFSIPTPALRERNFEILVHLAKPIDASSRESAVSLLVPSLDTPTSISGRTSAVTFPIHRVLVYGEGMKNLSSFAAIETQVIQDEADQMYKAAVNGSWSLAELQESQGLAISPINLKTAELAIEKMRISLDKSFEYEHLWFASGMPAVSSWLLEHSEPSPNRMQPAIRKLIETICKTSRQRIHDEESEKLRQQGSTTVTVATRNVIKQALSIWAENAHAELRDRLGSAFGGGSWRKTKWWKLFWRVDDVGYLASDILQRIWLVNAEKEMIWIIGRIHQSGLLGAPKLRPTPTPDPEQEEQTFGGSPSAPTAADLAPQAVDLDEPPSLYQHPWPQDIARARSTLASLSVPPLQALSQALLLQAVSTNILASAFSVLLYISISTTSVYESGAIAAAGLVYSLRRLQTRWEIARAGWEVQVREEGRRVLRSTESIAKEAVDEYKSEIDEIGNKERAIAAEAVGKVEKALEDVAD